MRLLPDTTYTVSFTAFLISGDPTMYRDNPIGDRMRASISYGSGDDEFTHGMGSSAGLIDTAHVATGSTSYFAQLTLTPQDYTYSFTTASNFTQSYSKIAVSFYSYIDETDFAGLDNVVVTAVPEPGVVALVVCAGLGAAGVWHSRRLRRG